MGIFKKKTKKDHQKKFKLTLEFRDYYKWFKQPKETSKIGKRFNYNGYVWEIVAVDPSKHYINKKEKYDANTYIRVLAHKIETVEDAIRLQAITEFQELFDLTKRTISCVEKLDGNTTDEFKNVHSSIKEISDRQTKLERTLYKILDTLGCNKAGSEVLLTQHPTIIENFND